jgi:toxin ParE1/3/4
VRIAWSLEAIADLDGIQEFLEGENPYAAKRMWVRIHERIGLQAQFPLSAPQHRDGRSRRLVVSGTPYIVLYVVDGEVLKVEAVFHGAQDR